MRPGAQERSLREPTRQLSCRATGAASSLLYLHLNPSDFPMPDFPPQSETPAVVPLAGGDSLTSLEPESLRAAYALDDDDLGRIRALAPQARDRMDHYISCFYRWLEQKPEHGEFFDDEATLQRAQSGQRDYWIRFFGAEVDKSYVEDRKHLGNVHAQIGLPLEAYVAGMSLFLDLYLGDLRHGNLTCEEPMKAGEALAKLVHLDTVVVVSTFSERTQQIITEQNASLMELSTPVSALWDGVLMLPIVGIVDSKRAQDMMDAMLVKIQAHNARVMILDISGVNVVDTAVANHFIKMAKATKLMGCEAVISGISPAIAQTIVALGIDLASINTRATLRDAVAFAFAKQETPGNPGLPTPAPKRGAPAGS